MTTTIPTSTNNALCAGDIHLLNARNPTSRIVANLRQYLLPLIPTAKIIFLNGDILDKSGALSDRDSIYAVDFFLELLMLANAHGVIVRILEGTKSHDRGQMVHLVHMHARMGYTNDLRYIDTIMVETIDALDVTLLYLPDNLPYASSDAAMDAVREQMTSAGVTQVDYAFCHGYFEHAVIQGAHAPRVCFREEQFSFVKHYVLCSHVHNAGSKGKVFYTQSFDRLTHGDETKKGFLQVAGFGTDAPALHFVENKSAMPFVTFDLRDIPSGDTPEVFRLKLKDMYTEGDGILGFVRVVHPDVVARKACAQIAMHYPRIQFSDLGVDEVSQPLPSDALIDAPTLLELPSAEQLPSVVFERLEGAYPLDLIVSCLKGDV